MPRSVLIVEDESLLARTLAKALRDAGYRAITAESAERAAELLFPASDFDVVLLDHRLPRATGLSLLERMRSEGLETPVILMTAYETASMRARADELAISGVFRKPFNLAEVLERIDSVTAANGGASGA